MCGIAGIVTLSGEPAEKGLVHTLAERLSHRGPDGSGNYVDGPVGLGHRRLAIIDPQGGAQPLTTADGLFSIVFNGEIYNFRDLKRELEAKGFKFRTASDTEVVLAAYAVWRESCLGRLRGMFAFAIWDRTARRLFLARDRVGIKPLVYVQTPEMFAFASELQALNALNWSRDLDLEALDLYLHFQYIPAPYTAYKSVRKLLPAHYMIVDENGAQEPVRYWRLTMRPDGRPSEGEWLERVDECLDSAVRSHLVSDVPFGAFLSGGVDSSTVVAYMSRHLSGQVKTFSIAFDDPRYDESRYAREVSDHLRTEHHEERVTPDAFGLLPQLVRHYGEPFADSSALPTYYVSRLASHHVKMVLSGDGGDENFAGYPTYTNVLQVHRPPSGGKARARFAVGSLARALSLRPALPRPDDTWFESVAYFGEGLRASLWRPEYVASLRKSRAWFDTQARAAPRNDPCSRFQYIDLHTYLPNDILTKVDIASMCHGLEVRVPLLDHQFMELVAQIPWTLKLRKDEAGHASSPRYTSKYLLKKLAESHVPRGILHRPKQGFAIPIGDWLRGVAPEELRQRLCGALAELLQPLTVSRLITEHHSRRDHGPRLWSLLVLSEWLAAARDGQRDSATA